MSEAEVNLDAAGGMDFSGRRVITLAASAFVVLAAEPLFLLIDTAVVGHLGKTQLAALGAAGYVVTMLAVIGSALEYGTTGRAARCFGRGDRDAAIREGVHASWLAAIIGLGALVVGELVAGPLSRLITGQAGAVASDSTRWLRIALFGLPALLLVQAGNGWLRGVQNTQAPVRIVLSANVASAIASPVLVYPVGLGLAGSAWANVGAQWFAAGFCLVTLAAEQVGVRPDWRVIVSLLIISRDLVLRSAVFEVSFLLAAAVAGRMGSAQLAAHQVGVQLWEFLALLLDSFGIAAMALVPAALGAGDTTTAARVAWRVGRLGAVAGLALAACMAAGWAVLPALFTSDHEVRAQIRALWPFLVAILPVGGVVFALDGALLGAGDTAFVRSLTLTGSLLGFVPLCLLALHLHWGLGGVWAGLALFIAIRFLGMVLRTRTRRWMVVGVRS